MSERNLLFATEISRKPWQNIENETGHKGFENSI